VPFVSPPMIAFVTTDLACSSGCCGGIELLKDDVSNVAVSVSGETGISFQNGGVSHVPSANQRSKDESTYDIIAQVLSLEDLEWN
jgi:hypothetical protein